MPRVNDTAGGRFHIPGVYEKLATGTSRYRRGPLPDPRLRLQELSVEQTAVLDWLQAEACWRHQQRVAAQLAAGEPYEVPRMYFGGHSVPRDASWPAWLRPHSEVKRVRVYADDTIEPVRNP